MARTVKDIMTKDVKVVKAQDDIHTVAVIMKENNVGVVPVVDDQNKCIGLVTDRDIVVRGLAERKNASFKVQDVISADIISVKPDTGIEQAAQMMAKEQIRRLPVMENNQLMGIVSMADLATEKSARDEAGYAIAGVSKSSDKHSQ
ncbi:CBS domain-containing protein [Paenibacillus sp. P26]|nr:CBS domain-containing protein [Paenibacillus sp. P26]